MPVDRPMLRAVRAAPSSKADESSKADHELPAVLCPPYAGMEPNQRNQHVGRHPQSKALHAVQAFALRNNPGCCPLGITHPC